MTQSISRPSEGVRKQSFDAMLSKLTAWSIPDDALDRVHDAAKASLTEVKALTEYEDGKVSRLLTVVAFLSAVVGAVFTRFASDYSWPSLDPSSRLNWFLPSLTYLAFFAYIIMVTWAVGRILTAIRPTFNIPETWRGPGAGLPSSMVFYRGILDVDARTWGETFEKLGATDGKSLKSYYAKCYVTEAYLVAEKVAEKLQRLEPGIDALRRAMGVLIAFFLLFGATVVLVDPTRVSGRQAPVTSAPRL